MFEECVKAGHHSKQAKLGAEGHHLQFHDDYDDGLHHQHDHRHLDNDNVNDSQQATLIQLWNLNSYIFKEAFA